MIPTPEYIRRALCAMHVNARLPVPRHLMPPPGDTWRRYESDKEALGVMPPEEYDRKIQEIAP